MLIVSRRELSCGSAFPHPTVAAGRRTVAGSGHRPRLQRGSDERRRLMRERAETKLIDEAAGDVFRRAWWAVALRGLAAIVLGIMMLTAPRPTFALFVALLGIYVFVDGVLTVVAAFHAEAKGQSWWPYLLEGLVSIGVG